MSVDIKNRIYPILFLKVIFINGCDESDISESLAVSCIGTWKINKVAKDDVLQENWKNLTLSIELDGTYKLDETPYDTIWNAYAAWERINERLFLLDDSIFVNYWHDDDSLYLSKILP